jgi:RNA polymerase sigma-70 factor (ECF subfamily)
MTVIRRCQTGDREAFRWIVEQYGEVLRGTAHLLTRDTGLSEDIVQETLIKAWTHLPSLRNPANLKAWLVRILVNEVRQAHRKKQVPSVFLEQIPDPPSDHRATETSAVRVEQQERVGQALEELPLEQRDVVVLRYFAGLSVREVAVAMSCREGTVKSRLSRALDRLGEILRSDETLKGAGRYGYSGS